MATDQELKIIEDNKNVIKKRIDNQNDIIAKLNIINEYKTNSIIEILMKLFFIGILINSRANK